MRSFQIAGHSRRLLVNATEDSALEASGYALLFIVVWMLIGLLAAVILGQRGHDVRPLIGLGVVMGPLLVPYARTLERRNQGESYVEIRPSVSARPPGVHVVVVLIGDVGQSTDLLALLRQLGGDSTRLTIAAAASGARQAGPDNIEPWFHRLMDGAVLFGEFDPRLVALRGRVDRAVEDLVGEEGADVVVITGRTRYLPRFTSSEPRPVVLIMHR